METESITIPEYRVQLYAPGGIVGRYLRYIMFSIFYWREVEFEDGYNFEVFEGVLLVRVKNRYIRTILSNIFLQLANTIKDNNSRTLTLFLYKKEVGELLERWVFDINTTFDVTLPWPTLGELMNGIEDKLGLLPLPTEPIVASIVMT